MRDIKTQDKQARLYIQDNAQLHMDLKEHIVKQDQQVAQLLENRDRMLLEYSKLKNEFDEKLSESYSRYENARLNTEEIRLQIKILNDELQD